MIAGDIVKFKTTGPGGSYYRVGKVLATVRAGDDAIAALPFDLQPTARTINGDIAHGIKRIALVDRVAVLVSSEFDKTWQKSKGKIFFPIPGNIVER